MVCSIFVKDEKISQNREYQIKRVRKKLFLKKDELSIKRTKVSQKASFLTSPFGGLENGPKLAE